MPNAENDAPQWAPMIGPMRAGESRYRDLPILKRCLDCGAPLEWFEVMTQVRDDRAVTPLCLPCTRVTPRGADQ